MKRKTKKNINKGSLLLAGFLFIVLSYLDINADKESATLIASNINSIYTNVNANELLDILDNETGVVIIVNDKMIIKRFINILTNINKNEKIYIYNCKSDEIILTKNNEEIQIVQKESEDYSKLLNRLGLYTEAYIIDENEFTNYYKINTPMVMFVKNGNIRFSYYMADENITNEELSNIYKFGFEKLKEN